MANKVFVYVEKSGDGANAFEVFPTKEAAMACFRKYLLAYIEMIGEEDFRDGFGDPEEIISRGRFEMDFGEGEAYVAEMSYNDAMVLKQRLMQKVV